MSSASAYEVIIETSARTDLRRLPPEQARRVLLKIAELRHDPRPPGVRKLVGTANGWRIRVGARRVIYQILDRERLVRVTQVKPRDKAYD